jgi:hypothetical protein
LADWAQSLAAHWHDLSHMIWAWVFSWVHIKVSRVYAALLSFVIFSVMAIVGGNMHWWRGTQVSVVRTVKNVLQLLIGVFLYLLSMSAMFGLVTSFVPNMPEKIENEWLLATALIAVISPILYLCYLRSSERLWILAVSILFAFVGGCLLIPLTGPTTGFSITFGLVFTIMWLTIGGVAVMLFSPLKQLTKRLSFIVLGMLTLVALSEISKLNLHQYLQPPKVSDSSVR